MGATFTHFNPSSDENGQNIIDRFNTQIKNIDTQTSDVYCIFVRDDGHLYKHKINSVSKPIVMVMTPLQLYTYIFGEVFKTYTKNDAYRAITDAELESVCNDFHLHLKNVSSINADNADNFEPEEKKKFAVRFPDNAYGKYIGQSEILYSRIIDKNTNRTLYHYFPIMIEENNVSYHVVLKYERTIDVKLLHFNPFQQDLYALANSTLSNIEDLCIIEIKADKVHILFAFEQTSYIFPQTKQEIYSFIFGVVYKKYIENPLYKNMTKSQLDLICYDFELYLKDSQSNIKDLNCTSEKDINNEEYSFHKLFPNNLFSRCLGQTETMYMSKLWDSKTKKIDCYYFPIFIRSNNKTYNVLIMND